MPAIQVRDFPVDIYEKIREEAKANGRSITQQTKVIVIEHFTQKERTQAPSERAGSTAVTSTFTSLDEEARQREVRRRELFARIHENAKHFTPIPDGFPDPAELVREMREER